nr:cysteine-rich receptor-like protein kinase 7 [Quercus suber]
MFTPFVCVGATTIASLQFDLATIQAATNKFSDDNKLSGGGFGEVYKGTFLNRQEIVVKTLKKFRPRCRRI